MGQLFDALLADLAHTPSLDEVAQQLHMSRRTFSRQFRAATGMAPSDYRRLHGGA